MDMQSVLMLVAVCLIVISMSIGTPVVTLLVCLVAAIKQRFGFRR